MKHKKELSGNYAIKVTYKIGVLGEAVRTCSYARLNDTLSTYNESKRMRHEERRRERYFR